jgi:hypothetical protein
MALHEKATLCYGQLACLSHEKSQPLMRDRFLLLMAASACRAGWPEIAAIGHRLLMAFAPQHQATRFATMADGLRDEEFAKVVQHWEKFCPLERAEMLLSELGDAPDDDIDDTEQAGQLQALLQSTFAASLPRSD